MEGTNKTEVTATAGYECAVDLGLVYLGHWAVELNHYLIIPVKHIVPMSIATNTVLHHWPVKINFAGPISL